MNVLFVDERNAASSQLAQAWAEHAGLGARSAGLRPASRLDANVFEVLDAHRLGSAEREPRPLAVEDLAWADVVVLIDCDRAVVVPSPALVVHWQLPNDAGTWALELSAQVRRLVVELVMDVAGLPIRGVGVAAPPAMGAGRLVR